MVEPIPLEKLASRVFELRQKIRWEVDRAGDKEINEYERTHQRPSWSLGILFNSTKRRDYGERLKAYDKQLLEIERKYRYHPLVTELAQLQAACPHNYGPWSERENGGKVRRCSVCQKEQSIASEIY